MIVRSAVPRKLANFSIKVISTLSALLGIAILAWILYEVIKRGSAALNWSFFFHLPTPPNIEGGGLANAILGTSMITLLATLAGVPIGLLAGVYLAEFGQNTRLGSVVRFTSNVMMGIPSIIVGLFVYTLLVLPWHHFSGYAGAVSLAIIMLPIVARTTEDMLRLVPNSLRESALALGAPRWKATTGSCIQGSQNRTDHRGTPGYSAGERGNRTSSVYIPEQPFLAQILKPTHC